MLRLGQTWEVSAWENAFGKVPNILLCITRFMDHQTKQSTNPIIQNFIYFYLFFKLAEMPGYLCKKYHGSYN